MSAPVAPYAEVTCEERPDGSRILRVAEELGDHPSTLADAFLHGAAAHPDRVLAAERDGDAWRTLTYGAAAEAATALGQAYLNQGCGPEKPVLLLSGNSLDHLVLTLACYLTGVPAAPVSVAYSVRSTDLARLRAIATLVRPGVVYADDGDRYRRALTAAADAAGTSPATVVSRRPGEGDTTVEALRRTPVTDAVERARNGLRPDTVAKILFTSGSTGIPKGVLNTHRMLCANQQMLRQIWPHLVDEPPVLTDWLPWSHTFGGNHNLNLVLCNGGSLFIDDGSPLPEALPRTIDALRRMPPTVLVNVPAGYTQLTQVLESDPALAERVLSRARVVLYAGADLPDALRERLRAVARTATGRDIPVVSSWGATETGPAASSTWGGVHDGIGIPLPGVELKLAPVDGRAELRVRSPSVTPAYVGADLSDAFDEEGYYRTGDAARLLDADGDPRRGLAFDGRIAEDFKLATGTWVAAGRLRNALLSAAGVLSDAVLVGADRPDVAAIAWPALGRVNELLGTQVADVADLLAHDGLRRHLGTALAALNEGAGAASRVARLVLVAEPPSIDSGEITDKGYLNQHAVVERRAAEVALLHADTPDPNRVITAGQR
ncbi:AMP-binding protein [Streptomyces sp. NPDC000594]|uniref:AMP-binding protein n=1 Tax=Streptomyces sp. NPDC000594 TaxID=3154261 RepID=UPI00332738BA